MSRFPPERIVCLSTETVETLYLLGEEARIVGVTGFARRPPRARREKARIGGFSSADIAAVRTLEPDLVLAFSDLQAGIAQELVRAGLAVHVFNQRDLAGCLAAIRTLGALVGRAEAADALALKLERRLAAARARQPAVRPRLYIEEWDEPMIAGIGWVSELAEAAGCVDVFAERARAPAAADRIVTPEEVVRAAPDIVVASWCGKRFDGATFAARPGFADLPAVRSGAVHDVPGDLLLSPGPALFTDGLEAIERIVARWATRPEPLRALA